MRDFNRNDRGGGRDRRRFSGGGRDFGRREMHRTICAQCGKDCEVPFRPKDDRPVYCSDCFEKRRNEDSGSKRSYSPDRRDRGSTGGRDSGQLIDQLKSLNAKLDRILTVLEPKTVTTLAQKTEVTDIVVKPKVIKPKTPKKKVKEEKVELV